MKRYRTVIMLIASTALAVAALDSFNQFRSSAQTVGCNTVTHTTWFGGEVNTLQNNRRTVTFAVLQPITVTNVTMSDSLAPFGEGFNQALYLVGFAAPGKVPWGGVDSPDPVFGPPSGYIPGFHGNQPQTGVLDSDILKSKNGLAAHGNPKVSTDTQIPQGDQIFLNIGIAGPANSDAETQVDITYEVCQ